MNVSSRRKFLRRSACAMGALALPGYAWTQEPDTEQSGVELLTRPALEAVNQGLDFLAKHQNDDGTFDSGGYSRNVAVVALAGMAFMSSGSTPGRGRYGAHVNRCVSYLLDNTQPESGFIAAPDTSTHGPMYGHGFATLFLSEAYGMSRHRELRDRLSAAVELIVKTQNDEGGWRYYPRPYDADISVTVCQVMALRAARNAGIHVPHETIERCIDYVKRSQNPDGGFMYMIQGGQSAFPRSAAGMVALYSSGIYEGPEIDRGLKYLEEHLPRGSSFHRESHYFYGHYYAVQAMWHTGGERWRDWYTAIRDELLSLQRGDGSWMDSICQEYGTAMACIVLQMPNNYLPIFQR